MTAGSIPLDPIEPTATRPGLAAIPLAPTVWDDAEDGQHAVTVDGKAPNANQVLPPACRCCDSWLMEDGTCPSRQECCAR